jgi:hypothetical protein
MSTLLLTAIVGILLWRKHTATDRSPPRYAGHAHPKGTSVWTISWASDQEANSENHHRDPADAARFTLYRFVSASEKGIGECEMGNGSGANRELK